MKKFLILGLILSISLFISCPGPVDPIVQITFEEAVQEVYQMAGSTLFYSLDGIKPTFTFNKASSENEIPGVCTDYAIEFAYYWNEVKNYDEIFGKAYFIWVPSNSSTFYIADGNFVQNGTSKIREESDKFGVNANDYEADGVYRDVIYTSIIYSGKRFTHFGQNASNHMWIVINIGDDWYDLEPTSWDTGFGNDYPPNKISF